MIVNKELIGILLFLVILVGGYFAVTSVPEGAGWPILLVFVILEVVFAPVPGGAVAYLAAEQLGYWAWPLLYAGNIIGATIVFFLVRRLGAPYVKKVASEKELKRYDRYLRGHPVLLWFAYAIPIMPIDVITIGAGLSELRKKRFFTILITGLVFYTGLQTLIAVQLTQYLSIINVLSGIALIAVLMGAVWVWRHIKKRNVKASD